MAHSSIGVEKGFLHFVPVSHAGHGAEWVTGDCILGNKQNYKLHLQNTFTLHSANQSVLSKPKRLHDTMVQPAADTQIREAAFNTLVTQPPQTDHEISQDTSLDLSQDNSEYRSRIEADTSLDGTTPEAHKTTQADNSAGKWPDIDLRASYESLSAKINQMLDPEQTVDVEGALQAKLEEMAIAILDLDTSEQLIYDKSSLSSMETKQLNAILNKYEGTFAKSKLDIGTFRFLTACINLKDESFSYIESERVLKGPEEFEESKQLVTQLLSAGVIKKATDLS